MDIILFYPPNIFESKLSKHYVLLQSGGKVSLRMDK